MQPYALRAPEVILGLGWDPAIDIWCLGCMVKSLFSISSLRFLNDCPLQMYEFATGCWPFDPEVVGDISRDVVHLAQMSQRTGQGNNDAILRQYEIREKRRDLKGKEMHSNVHRLFTFAISRHI